MKIGIVGGGVAGVSAAWLLDAEHEVTLIEAGSSLGGHTCTLTLESGPDAGTSVDAGFITFNERTYPLFIRWLAQLGVESRVSDMSFGYTCELTGLTYGGHNLNTLFARRRHLIHPDFLRMLLDVARFNTRSRAVLRSGHEPGTLRQYVQGYGSTFVRHYLLPLGAAIWSAPPEQMLDFPALTYLRFMENHGLLSVLDRPTWRTVKNGSHSYLQAFRRSFRGHLLEQSPVEQVRRHAHGAEARIRGDWLSFDRLVLACHADQSLALLADPCPDEQRWLGTWRYQPNRAVVHTDLSALPRLRRVHSSWNYLRSRSGGPATLTYDMNRLQGLQTRERYLVSLNPQRPVEPDRVIAELSFSHPLYTAAAVASQTPLRDLGGRRHTYYCGSYLGYGFHEDAVRSAVNVANTLGGRAL